MKITATGLMSVVVGMWFAVAAPAQVNPRATATLNLNGKNISVEYGRPSLNGRTTDDLLGTLQPGDTWRLGADDSTTFRTAAGLAFPDASLPAGEYSLWMTRVTDRVWNLVFNRQTGVPGTEHDASQDFVFVPLIPSRATTRAQRLRITLKKSGRSGIIRVQWGTMVESANFKTE